MSVCIRALFFASALIVVAIETAYSQTTFASITGLVTDASGSAVPNAVITATNQGTNIRTSATSNEAGYYTIAQLKDGTYSVQVRAPGFQEFVATDIVLA